MPTNKMYRQGDVLLVATKGIPSGAKRLPRDDGRVVLAYGEITGHAHAIDEPAAELLVLLDPFTGPRHEEHYLRIEGGEDVALTHEEHDTIMVPPGNYRVVRQREYTPTAPRWVAD